MELEVAARRAATRVLAPLALGLVVGCAPTSSGGSGCGSPPQATDAAYGGVSLHSFAPPCGYSFEAARGSDPHLIATFNCPGESDQFLAAIKVDGKLLSLRVVRGAGYGSLITLDAGAWEAPDTAWHDVELVLDPLNLFAETDESNNRGITKVRVAEPDAALIGPECGFTVPQDAGGDGFTLVSQVWEGIPVEVRLRLNFGGPYSGIRRSMSSGAALAAADTVAVTDCASVTYLTSNFTTRWLPPGPGVYDVEFRIEPLGPVTDRIPGNNAVTKRLTVMSTGAPALHARVGRPAVVR